MSKKYWIAISLWLLVFVTFLIINHIYIQINDDTANLILGGIAVSISIISLGIANKVKPSFTGDINCWILERKPIQIGGEGKPIYHHVNFEIINNTHLPVYNLIINFRMPKNILHLTSQNSRLFKVVEFGETIVLTCDTIPFLGTNKGDNNFTIEHLINLVNWTKKTNIFITIAGDNILPTTVAIKQENKSTIILSNPKDKSKL